MDLTKCRYILTIAELGNYSKAASAMFVSQPYLSKVVSETEEEFGIRLFHREKNRITLTKAGESYLQYARELLLTEQNMRSSLREFSSAKRGQLRIGFPPSNASYILPYALKDFSAVYPDIELKIEEGSNQTLLDRALNATLDLCFFSLLDYPVNLDFELVKMEPILLVLPPDSPLGIPEAKGNFMNPPVFFQKDLRKLDGMPCICLNRNKGMGMIAHDIFSKSGITPDIVFELSTIETAYRFAAAGTGFTFIPQICARFLDFEIHPYYFQIALSANGVYHRSHVAAFRKGRSLQKTERDLIEMVRKYA